MESPIVTFRCPEKMVNQVNAASEVDGIDRSEWIRRACLEKFKRDMRSCQTCGRLIRVGGGNVHICD